MCSGPQFSMVWERETAGHTDPQSGIRAVDAGAETLSPFCLVRESRLEDGATHIQEGSSHFM